MMTPIATTDPDTNAADLDATTLLDDLLLDAQVELEHAECPALAQAVAEARVTLVRHAIVYGLSPSKVPTFDPETLAPRTRDGAPVEMPLAEKVARRFHARFEELAKALGYRTRKETSQPWEDTPPVHRQLMIATAAAVLQDFGAGIELAPRH